MLKILARESTARVWLTLRFSKKPLRQEEIAKKIDYSQAHVSDALRMLKSSGLVQQHQKKPPYTYSAVPPKFKIIDVKTNEEIPFEKWLVEEVKK